MAGGRERREVRWAQGTRAGRKEKGGSLGVCLGWSRLCKGALPCWWK